jgi:hypothetical protein
VAAKRDTVSDRIPEWKLQAGIAAHLDSRIALEQPFAYAASLEGVIGTLKPYQAQLAVATGVKRGEPDLRLYFDHGRAVFVELKGEGGKLTDSQKVRIPILRGLGFIVHIIFATSCDDAAALVGAIVDRELAWPGGSASMDSASWWPKARGK